MKFGEHMRVASQNLAISRRHDVWLKDNSNPVYSPMAVAFATEQLLAIGRVRKGTVSSSSLGSCPRKQQFTWLGWPELAPTSRTAQIFHNGMMMHLRWQMAGMTEGWLTSAEVPIPNNVLNLSGTMDGVADDNRVVELKSINSNGYSGVTTFGPKEAHIMQVGAYMMATGREMSSIIYENKDTQDFREIEVPLTDELASAVIETAGQTWGLINQETLAEPLSGCEDKTGWVYASCPFRDRCLTTRDWHHAKEI